MKQKMPRAVLYGPVLYCIVVLNMSVVWRGKVRVADCYNIPVDKNHQQGCLGQVLTNATALK